MNRQTTFRPGLETLENRRVLAGNVTAFVQDGDLIVTGDDAANTITVESAGVGIVQVRGFNGGGTATRVNGSPNALQTFAVSDDIFIRMNSGNDLVRVTNLVISGELLVNLGAGHDEAVLGRDLGTSSLRFGGTPSGPLFVADIARVIGGDNNDFVTQSDVHGNGAGVVNLGAGLDGLQVERPLASAANVEYGGAFAVLPGSEADTIAMNGLVVDSNVIIDDGGGPLDFSLSNADVFGNLSIFSDEGNDQVNVANTNVRGQLTVNTDGGADTVILSAIADRLFTDLGASNDVLEVNSSNMRVLNLQLGIGSDTLRIQSATTTRIDAFGNDGNDLFQVTGTSASDAFFFGDADFDTYRDSSLLPNAISNLQLFSIERRERA